jgi:hypothetical protein
MRRFFLAQLGAACVGLAHAQAYPPTLQPSLAAQCLTPAAADRGQPDYPSDLLERKDGGVVKIELVFSAPDRAPAIRVLDENADPKFLKSVNQHVSRFRVPCMVAGAEPVRLVQTYFFLPNDGRTVMATVPKDAEDAQRRLRYRCLKRIVAGERPEYPPFAQRAEVQGKFMVRLRFVSATAEPEIAFLDADSSNDLRISVEQFVRGYRMPCMAEEPVVLNMLFVFSMEGGERTRLRDLALPVFLSNVDPASLPLPAYFDLGTMRCPFDVRLEYLRPHTRNRVLELENSDPARQPLLDWLSQMTFKLPSANNRKVLGESMTIKVPCGTVNLQPKASPSDTPPKPPQEKS